MVTELLTCNLCCNSYDQSLHLPKVLACSHTFCQAISSIPSSYTGKSAV